MEHIPWNSAYYFLKDNEFMVVPDYASGSTADGTRTFVWKVSKGWGYCTQGVTVLPARRALELAQQLTRDKIPF